MKKFLLMSLGLVLLLGAAKASFAATSTTAQVFLHVTITSGTVDIERTSANDIEFGQVLVGSSTVTTLAQEGQFTNISTDVYEDFAIAATNTASWTFLSTAPATNPGINNVRLSALWVATGTPPADTDFAADDTITNTSVESTTDVYARSADADTVKGFDVPHASAGGNARYIYFRLDAPDDGSTNQGVETDITVTVTASIS